jgi:hypothetical protein
MEKKHNVARIFFLVAICMAIPSKAIAGLGTSKPTISWDGAWTDKNKNKNGGVIIVREKDGFLDVSGTDLGSTYNSVCLIESTEKKKYTCVGSGVRYGKQGSRFLYKSSMQLTDDGLIKEKWEVFSINGKNINGTAIFEKLNEETEEER